MSQQSIRISVGVVVERRKAVSEWADMLWCPVAILAGVPDTVPWTPLSADANAVTYYAGSAEIALYRSEAENYRRNLVSDAPVVWVALQTASGEPPYTIGGVTADPAEGEGWTEPSEAIVEAVAMPQAVREEIEAFVARCPARPGFVKRRRDRADPEALARRIPPVGRRDERR